MPSPRPCHPRKDIAQGPSPKPNGVAINDLKWLLRQDSPVLLVYLQGLMIKLPLFVEMICVNSATTKTSPFEIFCWQLLPHILKAPDEADLNNRHG